MSPRRRNRIDEQFHARTIAMLESPAYRQLSLSAHRVLDRIAVELARHGGNDAKRLPVTYSDFEEYGIDRHAIAPAIRECVALGFLRITEVGRASAGEFRSPSCYELTFAYSRSAVPTDEWRKIKTDDEAKLIARAARQAVKPDKRKNKKPVGVFTDPSVGFPHRKSEKPVGVFPTTVPPEKPPLLSTSRGRGRVNVTASSS
jgi:hypothetical protein